MSKQPYKKSKKTKAGPKQHRFKLSFSSLKNLDQRVDRWLRQLTKKKGYSNLPKSLLQDLKLAVIEGVGNAFRHGGCGRKVPCQLVMVVGPKQIQVEVTDKGPGFKIKPALEAGAQELATHGRGLWIIKNLVDELSYRRGKPNRLILKKKLIRPKNIDAALQLFHELQGTLQELKPLEALYQQFVDYIMELFNAERASLLIYSPELGVLKNAISRGISKSIQAKLAIKPGEGVAGYVFQSSRPLLVNNLKRARAKGIQARNKGYATNSFVSVPVIASPMQIGESHLGVLNLTDRRDGTPFSSQDLKLLNLMATQAASLFRIRALIDQVKKGEAINRELEIVSEIQERMLLREFPKIKGIQIAGRCQLLPRGGGDYFDVFKVGEGLRGVMADVSGHNVGSALTMASLRSMVRSLFFDPSKPGELLKVLRWAMHEELTRLGHFISCWVWELLPSGQLSLSGAGHPPALIFRAGKQAWESIAAHHLPLGLEDEDRAQNQKLRLKQDDWIFFYTDGLFDPRMRETGLDQEKILQAMVELRGSTPEKMVEEIFNLIEPHHQLLESPDDVALLAIKKK